MDTPVNEQRAIIRIKSAENLDNNLTIGSFLIDACAVLGFSIILRPTIVNYVDEDDEAKSGRSGVIMFSESSMTIHTWPKLNYAAIDIFSCESFDAKELVKVVEQYFVPMELELKEVK